MRLDDYTRKQIDQAFAPWDTLDGPGAALAVVRGGEVIYARGYGLANLEYGLPITPNTVFHVASVSKQFTAMAVMLMVGDGLLDLHQDIHTYLPELPDFGHEITLWHLLHHTSGLRDQWELLVAAGWRMDDVITREQVLKLVQRQRELNFLPGAEYLYCNTGFTLAAEIVARVSGQSLRQFCAERIFAPLGMAATHFHDDHEEIVPNRAYSYSPKIAGGWKKSVLSYANVGATSLFTTVLDLAKWLGNFDLLTVGGSDALRQMETPFQLQSGKLTEYGLGLMLEQYRGRREVGHSGADAGFRAWCGRFPEQDLGLVILSNAACFIPRELAHRVADLLLPPSEAEGTPQALPQAEDYLGQYFLLTDGSPVTIHQEDGVVRLDALGRCSARLQPLAALTWDCPDLSLRVVGQRGPQGRIDGLALQSPRMNLAARRLPDQSLGPSQLADYEGDYYSQELNTTYQLVVEQGRLLARHQRHSDLPLIASGPDRFIGGNWRVVDVQFERDATGRVDAMSWSGNRVRNLRFKRKCSVGTMEVF